MGRKLMRVPLDFAWPIGKLWEGYINPHYRECPKCRAGYSKTYDLIAKYINPLLWDNEALKNKEYVQITTFLCDREPRSGMFGHDSSDAYSAVKKLGILAGLPKEWCGCDHCNGSGIDPEIKDQYEAWQDYHPPGGEGFQLWETTSEGSPDSPVFETMEALCKWAEANATTFAHHRATKEQWMQMLSDEFVYHQQGNAIFI